MEIRVKEEGGEEEEEESTLMLFVPRRALNHGDNMSTRERLACV